MKPERIAFVVGLLVLAGCTLPVKLPDATSDTAPPGRVILVGKIEIDPPMEGHEQSTEWNVIGDGAILNRISMATGPQPVPLQPNAYRMADWKDHISARWGETFIVTAPRHPRTWLRGGMMRVDMSASGEVWFPGGWYFDVPEGANAVYIGTLRYSRGDFYRIRKVEVRDEYRAALKAFREKFGAGASLNKALLRKGG